MPPTTNHWTVHITPFTCGNGAVVTEYHISGDLSADRAADAAMRSYGPESTVISVERRDTYL